MNGAQAMVKCLEAEGISRIFGYPGVAIAPFYDALYDSRRIEHILSRQEQNAGHEASGYARISRRAAVCVTSSGPGATNLITALATAYADSIPIIAITGQVDSHLLGKDVFQEADMRGATKSFVKYSYLVKNADDIPRVFKEAFYIASTGRQGPVLIDIPRDVQMAQLRKEFVYPEEVNIRGYRPNTKGNAQQMAKVIAAINEAQKPLLVAGGGVILGNGEPVVREFCEKFQIPLVHTMMGIGVLPKAHPLYFGMLGNNGKPYANRAVANSDLLIVVGARIADRAVPKPENLERSLKVIHIDIDTAEIGKNLGPTLPLVGDVKNIFRTLIDSKIDIDTSSWIGELEKIKKSTVDQRKWSNRLVNPMHLRGRRRPEPALVCGQLCDEERPFPDDRRHGDHGLLDPRSHRRQDLRAEYPGGGSLRRRRLPDDDERAGHRGRVQGGGQGPGAQEPLSRPGPRVSGEKLRTQVFRRASSRLPAL